MRIVFYFLCIFLPSVSAADIILGVHPYLDAKSIIERFQPLADHLSSKLGIAVEVRVGKDYESHIQAIGSNAIDIAFLGPASYVKMVELYGDKPILARLEANGKPTFSGHIITGPDSHITELKGLHNKLFAFGDKNSTMSRLVPQAMLQQQGINLGDLAGYRFYKGHKNVAMAVMSGDADAGAVKEEIFLQFEKLGMRSLEKTPEISEHLFVSRSNLEPALLNRIKSILLDLNRPDDTIRILKPIKKNLSGLVPATPEDYDSLRRLMRLVNTDS
jgi:phosphonate transport system substrate-binding protein